MSFNSDCIIDIEPHKSAQKREAITARKQGLYVFFNVLLLQNISFYEKAKNEKTVMGQSYVHFLKSWRQRLRRNLMKGKREQGDLKKRWKKGVLQGKRKEKKE